MANTNFTDGQKDAFQKNAVALIKESEGANLMKYAEKGDNSGKTITFYRLGALTAVRTAVTAGASGLNLYTGQGTGTQIAAIHADVQELSSGNEIPKMHIKTMAFDIKSGSVKAHAMAIGRDLDKLITEAVTASTDTNIIKKTTAGKFDTDEGVKSILGTIALIKARAKGKDVAVIMNDTDQAKLYESDRFLSSDFATMVNGGSIGSAMGCTLYSYAEDEAVLPVGTIQVIAQYSVGCDRQGSSVEANMFELPGKNAIGVSATCLAAGAVIDGSGIAVITESATV